MCLGLGYVCCFDWLVLIVMGEVVSDGLVVAGFNLVFSLGLDLCSGGFCMMVDKFVVWGSVLVCVYCDLNGNGCYDVNELWEKDVVVMAGCVLVD